MYAIKCFFFFAISGFLMETIGAQVLNKPYNSSVLIGPWTTVYGLAFFVILGIHRLLQKKQLKKWKEVLLFFAFSTILLTFLEFICGVLILKFSHVIYWSYKNMKFALGDFICLEVALLWGLTSTFICYILYPWVKKYIQRFPNSLTILLCILYGIDVIYAILK